MDLLLTYGSDDEDTEHNARGSRVDPIENPPVKRAKVENGDLTHRAVTKFLLPSATDLLSDIANGNATSNTAGQQVQLPASTANGPDAARHQQQNVSILPNTGLQLPPEPPRVRIFAHVEGNFATVVYIAVDASAAAQLQSLAVDLLSKVTKATASSTLGSSSPSIPETAQHDTAVGRATGKIAPSTSAQAATSMAAECSSGGLHLWPTFPWTTAAAAPPITAAGAAAGTSATATALASAAAAQGPDAADQQLPLHMSISRTVPIKKVQIDSLQAALTKQLKPFKGFKLQLQGLLCLVNDSATRSFVGIKVATGEKQVVRMVEAVNRAFITHGLQTFYEDPLPHVSLAWTPGDQASRLQPWLDTFSHAPITLKVSQVVCQVSIMTVRALGRAAGTAAPQSPVLNSKSLLWGYWTAARRTSTAASTTAAGTAAAAGLASQEKHYVVVGAGLAGLATAYHLLKQSSSHAPVHVTVYDAVGIGAGGSGAAAGLLHPFAPTGKLLWRAQDAMQAALELLEAAEAAETAAAQDTGLPNCIAWRTGMLKSATSSKQSQSFWKLYGMQQDHQRESTGSVQQQQSMLQQQRRDETGSTHGAASQALQAMLSAAVVDASTAQQLVPGLQLPITSAAMEENLQPSPHLQDGLEGMAAGTVDLQTQQAQQQQQGQQQQKQRHKQKAAKPPAGWSGEQSAALHIPGGITLQTQQYMHALWKACQQVAAARQDGSSTQLKIRQLHSLADLLDWHSASPTSAAPRDCNSFLQQHSNSSQEQQQQSQGDCQQLGQQQGQPEGQQRWVDAIVIAAGAAIGSLAEIGQQLPLTLCQGYTLDMVSLDAAATAAAAAAGGCNSASAAQSAHTTAGQQQIQSTPHAAAAPSPAAYPPAGPSLLGSPYLASQGGQVLVVGATKQYSYTTQQAVAELGRMIDPSILSRQCPHIQQQQQRGSSAENQQPAAAAGSAAAIAIAAEVAAAAEELAAGAAAAWPHIMSWSIGGIRTGVRALPPRSAQGAVPLAGKWMDLPAGQDLEQAQQQQQQAQGQDKDCQHKNSSVPVWLLVGLGARGLVYHAWLGKLMAAAVLDNSEDHLPPELLAWRQQVSTNGCSTVNSQ